MSKKSSPAPAEETPAKSGNGKALLLAAAGALLLLGGGVAAGVYFSSSFGATGSVEDPNRPKLVERSDEAALVGEGEEGHEPAPKVGTVSVANDRVAVDPRKYDVTYVPLDQPFTANLANGGIIQVGLSFATYYDRRVVENLKRQTVPIRSAALMVLSEQDPAVLSTPSGKQMLQRQLTDAVNQVLRQKEGFGGVDNVYFTSLVIQ